MYSDFTNSSDDELNFQSQIVEYLKHICVHDIIPSFKSDNSKYSYFEDSDILETGFIERISSDYDHGKVYLDINPSKLFVEGNPNYERSTSDICEKIKKELLNLGWVTDVLYSIKNYNDIIHLHNSDVGNLYPKESSIEEEILNCLKTVIDPDLNKDIVSCNFVKDLVIDQESSYVSFNLELTTPACPLKESFKKSCTDAIKRKLNYIKQVNIEFSSKTSKTIQNPGTAKFHDNLANVSYIIAIGSCKGGVGKSTLAVNFAYTLSMQGAKVGLVDCDIYGPSLEQLVPVNYTAVHYISPSSNEHVLNKLTKDSKCGIARSSIQGNEFINLNNKDQVAETKGLVPVFFEGVALMSYAYLSNSLNKKQRRVSNALRGPIASSIVRQLITGTVWGNLDYLILDLPPGTGDIQLSVAQYIQVDGAIIITTPQDLSLSDVERGLHLFSKLNIPVLALVENMSYFICDGCNKKHYIFKPGDFSFLYNEYRIERKFCFPIYPALSQCTFKDEDTNSDIFPFVKSARDDNSVYLEFKQLAEYVVRRLSFDRHAGIRTIVDVIHAERLLKCTLVSVGSELGVNEYREPNMEIFYVSFEDARRSCRCALCLDGYNQECTILGEDALRNISLNSMKPMGIYAIFIEWSDDHSSILPYSLLREIAQNSQTKDIQRSCLQSSLNW
ncbi:hypothetical protein ACR3K2_13560 [Cryptosporidium serpentis]